jgi:phage tail protein X
MAVYLGSRYETGAVGERVHSDGTLSISLFRGPLKTTTGVRYYPYQVTDGDRYDLIAYHAYQDSSKWWYVADANPELLSPDPLPAGSVIRIPDARDIG